MAADRFYLCNIVHRYCVCFEEANGRKIVDKGIVNMMTFLKYIVAYVAYLIISSIGMFVFTFGLIALVGGFAMLIGKGDRKGSVKQVWVMQFAGYLLAYFSGALAGLFILKLWSPGFSWLVFIGCVAILIFWHTYRQRFSYATDNAARLGYRQRIANHSGALTAFVLASVIINL